MVKNLASPGESSSACAPTKKTFTKKEFQKTDDIDVDMTTLKSQQVKKLNSYREKTAHAESKDLKEATAISDPHEEVVASSSASGPNDEEEYSILFCDADKTGIKDIVDQHGDDVSALARLDDEEFHMEVNNDSEAKKETPKPKKHVPLSVMRAQRAAAMEVNDDAVANMQFPVSTSSSSSSSRSFGPIRGSQTRSPDRPAPYAKPPPPQPRSNEKHTNSKNMGVEETTLVMGLKKWI
jgi:hypothetical protein